MKEYIQYLIYKLIEPLYVWFSKTSFVQRRLCMMKEINPERMTIEEMSDFFCVPKFFESK